MRRVSRLFYAVLAVVCLTAAVPLWRAFAGQEPAIAVALPFPEELSAPEQLDMFPAPGGGFLVLASGGGHSGCLLLDVEGNAQDSFFWEGSYAAANSADGVLYLTEAQKDAASSVSYTVLHQVGVSGGSLVPVLNAALLPNLYTAHEWEFCVDSSILYLLSPQDTAKVTCYSVWGEWLGEAQTGRQAFLWVPAAPGGGVYAAYAHLEGQLGFLPAGTVPDGEWELIDSDVPASPCRFLDETVLIDANGTVYAREESGALRAVQETGADGTCALLLQDGTPVVRTGGDTAQSFPASGTALRYRFPGELRALASSVGDGAALVEQEGRIYFLPLSGAETEELPEEPESSEPEESSTPEGSSEPEEPEPGGEGTGEWSSTFPVDWERGRITVPLETTFYALEQSFSLREGESVTARRPNGAALQSGFLMTGAQVTLSREGEEDVRLVVSVLGDLDGDAACSADDLELLQEYLNGRDNLTAAERVAADLNEDGRIGTADLFWLRQTLFPQRDEQSRPGDGAPW